MELGVYPLYSLLTMSHQIEECETFLREREKVKITLLGIARMPDWPGENTWQHMG